MFKEIGRSNISMSIIIHIIFIGGRKSLKDSQQLNSVCGAALS
jgi:hypothetical protein